MTRRMRRDDSAVSPVVGTIMMVAITVVLATVIFVLVSTMQKGSGAQAPDVAFTQNPTAHSLYVTRAEPGDWSAVEAVLIPSGTNTCTLQLNSGPAIASGARVTATQQTIRGGDVLTVVSSATGQTCQVQLTFVPANQLMGPAYSFSY